MAAAFLNMPLLTWIAEDAHWRGRLLPSRRWPNTLRRMLGVDARAALVARAALPALLAAGWP